MTFMPSGTEENRWSTNLPELLGLILRRLSSAPDCIRFGAVCKSWRSTLSENQSLLSPSVPFLLLPDGESESADRVLLDINNKKIHKLPSLIDARHKTIVGSSFGWLITKDDSTKNRYDIQLLNPITRKSIPLPPATMWCNYDPEDHIFNGVYKAALSCNPNSDRPCIIMAINSLFRTLSFCRIGDSKWTLLYNPVLTMRFEDVIYHKGCFYALSDLGTQFRIARCELGLEPNLVVVVPPQPPRPSCKFTRHYLVSSDEGLMMVTLFVNRGEKVEDRKSVLIDRVDLGDNKWEEVKSLDDRILLLGGGSSISISVHEMYGCKRNCIYVVDDPERGFRYGMDVSELEDHETQPFYPISQFFPKPLFWVTPNPW